MSNRHKEHILVLPEDDANHHVRYMDRFPTCAMILAIDFDGRHERFSQARTWVPAALAGRVFILGVWTRPEDLVRAGLGSYEQIGQAMWRDCGAEPKGIWNHDLLKHNNGELRRLCGASVARLFV